MQQAIPRTCTCMRNRSVRPTARYLSSSSTTRSHVGTKPIPLPSAITCTLPSTASTSRVALQDATTTLSFRGPKGSEDIRLPPGISATISEVKAPATEPTLQLACADTTSKTMRSRWGLYRALCANAVQGVTQGFTTVINLVGVGYRAAVEQDQLVLRVGFPRPVNLKIPAGLDCAVPAPTEIRISGTNKDALGKFASDIRKLRPPEPYNGKGIFVNGEKIIRKEIKKK